MNIKPESQHMNKFVEMHREFCLVWQCPHCKTENREPDNLRIVGIDKQCRDCGKQVQVSRVVYENGCQIQIT